MLLVNGSVDATRSYYSTGLLDITSQFGAPHFSETPYVLSRAMDAMGHTRSPVVPPRCKAIDCTRQGREQNANQEIALAEPSISSHKECRKMAVV